MELATAMETADKNTRDLKNGNPEEPPVNRVTKDPPEQAKQPPRDPEQSANECFSSGSQFHDADKCRYKDEACYKCRKKGHKANKCHSNFKRVFEMAENLETHITWRQQKRRRRKNATNTRCFT